MLLFRVRHYGQEEWTQLKIDGELEGELSGILGSALETSPLHVQVWEEEGWEDFGG